MRGVDLSGSWCSCETTSDGASVAAILAWGIALVPSLYVVGYMFLEALMVCAWVVTLWSFSPSMANQMARAHETALWPLGGRRIQLLTLHGGSSPMGSQASSLMSCFFQGCCCAPDGGAPASWTVTPSPGERGSLHSGSSGAHLVQSTLLRFPTGTIERGTRKQH